MERTTALALYERLVATNSDVDRKGAMMPYTSVNGHMFSVLTKDNKLALRLPEDARSAFLKRYKTTLCEQYGHVMPEYVIVPDSLLKKTNELKRFFGVSYTYVSGLKPKATTRTERGSTTKKSAPRRRRRS